MVRPLSGQREVFRRLQERNEARRVRTNEVREMGGLEPLPNPHEHDNMYYSGMELQEYLSEYVGRPNTRSYQRALLEGLQREQTSLIAGSSRPGRSMWDVSAYAREIADNNLRGQRANYIYIDTEGTFSSERFDELYSDIDYVRPSSLNWWDGMLDASPDWDFITGRLTYEEYNARRQLNDLKKEKNITNNKAKFVLEKEY